MDCRSRLDVGERPGHPLGVLVYVRALREA